MNKTQALNKIRKLKIQQFVKNNIAKFFPALRYSTTKEQAIQAMSVFVPYEMEEKDWDYLLSLSLRDIAQFQSEAELLKEIQKCEEVLLKTPKRVKKLNKLI